MTAQPICLDKEKKTFNPLNVITTAADDTLNFFLSEKIRLDGSCGLSA